MHHHLCSLLKQGTEFYKGAVTTSKEGEEDAAASSATASQERHISKEGSLEGQGREREGDASSQEQDKDSSTHPPKM